jgi:hypothetical protein
MPRLTRWFLKTAIFNLILALLVGLLLSLRAIWSLPAVVGGMGPVYFHLFMVGWVTELIFGVVYWLFPRFSKERPRGYEWLGWGTYALLNIGLALRVIGEPMNAIQPGAVWGWLLAGSALLQWLAGLCFVVNTWPRIHGGPRRRAISN